MRIIDNDPLYNRNARLGFFANVLGTVLVVIAAYVLFAQQQPSIGLYLALLLGGIIFLQVGLYFGRWSRRPDLALNQALKGFDNSYTIYHHHAGIPHLLVGPSGLWLLIPRFTPGHISYNKEKQTWRSAGGNLFTRFYRWLTQERVGRPHLEAMYIAADLDRYLQLKWEGKGALHVQAVIVFLDENVEVDAGDSPVPATTLKNLKKTLLSGEKAGELSKDRVQKLNAALQ